MTKYEKEIALLAKYQINCDNEAARKIRAITVQHVKSFISNNYAQQAIDKTQMYEAILEVTLTGIAKSDIETNRINKRWTPEKRVENAERNWADIFDLWKQERPAYMADLSHKVWENVETMQDAILGVVEGASQLGIDPVEIGKELETFIKYKDGGRRVVGRWGRLESGYKEVNGVWVKDEAKIRKAWKKEWKKETGGEGDFEKWLDENARDKRTMPGSGKLNLTQNMKDYSRRIGKAGLDYRAIRLERTESTARIAETQKDWVRAWGTGKVFWKTEPEREIWHCACEKLGNKWYDVDAIEIAEFPPHPNCRCRLVPEIPDWRNAPTTAD
ncbi:MAG: hypothetical protein LBJ41_01830 [Treponema sp.]|jgi:hypothetical protein|nr:hypothetical protein [Treponema sp.]